MTSCIAATSLCSAPEPPRTLNRRYSDLRAKPSSNTTMDATACSPWRSETSKHSMRSGASASPRASAISDSALERVVRSEARWLLCRASACSAFLATVSIRARLSPRCGTRTSTAAPRRAASQVVTAARSAGSAETSTSRGMAAAAPAVLSSASAAP